MTEKDLEIQQLRRENEKLKDIAWHKHTLCDYCKHHDADKCEEVDYWCGACAELCPCPKCNGDKWELADK